MNPPEEKLREIIVPIDELEMERPLSCYRKNVIVAPKLPEISLDIKTPSYVDRGTIGIRAEALLKTMRAAGILSLGIFTESGDDARTEYSITGINQDGSATGIGTQKKTEHRHENNFDTERYKAFNFIQAIVRLNTKRITDDIINEPEGSLRDAKAWITTLDNGIREELLKIAKENLLRPTKEDLLTSISVITMSAIFEIFSTISKQDYQCDISQTVSMILFILGLVGPGSMFLLGERDKKKIKEKIEQGHVNIRDPRHLRQMDEIDAGQVKGPRLSLLNYFGYELTNMLIAYIRLKTQKILVPIDREESTPS